MQHRPCSPVALLPRSCSVEAAWTTGLQGFSVLVTSLDPRSHLAIMHGVGSNGVRLTDNLVIREKEPWEASDGALFLLRELADVSPSVSKDSQEPSEEANLRQPESCLPPLGGRCFAICVIHSMIAVRRSWHSFFLWLPISPACSTSHMQRTFMKHFGSAYLRYAPQPCLDSTRVTPTTEKCTVCMRRIDRSWNRQTSIQASSRAISSVNVP